MPDPSTDNFAAQVLIVDDTPANLDVLTRLLEPEGYRVLAARDGEVALRVAAKAMPDVILLDVMMPGLDGYETCRRLRVDPATSDIPVLFVSARDETHSLVKGFEAGGVDYITKPIRADEVLARVANQVKLRRTTLELLRKNQELQEEIDRRIKAEDALHTKGEQLKAVSRGTSERWGVEGFIGRSKTMSRIMEDIKRLQNFATVNVLITGESGTGKELVARALHFGSGRASDPFLAVNCVAIPDELAESTLFGHVRGAFTGATGDRKGYFELAHGGTLFLDEIGDMPASLQAKLLRVLGDGTVMPVGASQPRKVDVRVIAATNADLRTQIAAGGFRRDLYFRLAQFTVHVPPLRERLEDVPLLAAHFLELFAREMGLRPPRLHDETLGRLMTHPFTGNVRELKNVIERSLIESGGGDVILPKHLHLSDLDLAEHPTAGVSTSGATTASNEVPSAKVAQPNGAAVGGLPLNLEQAEDLLIRRALSETGGNIAEAARKLGINRTRIYRKLAEKHS